MLPDNVLSVIMPCLQHQAGLTLEPMSKSLDVVPPSFCLIKQLHQGELLQKLEDAVTEVLDETLVRLENQEPNPEHTASNHTFLERCYFEIDVETDDMTDEQRERFKADDKIRREEGAELQASFTADWRANDMSRVRPDATQGTVKHHCKGCCANRRESVRKCTKAFMLPLKRRLKIPALNRWLQLWPVASVLTLIFGLHGIFVSAYHRLHGSAKELFFPDDSDSEGDAEAAADTMKARRKLEFKRNKKAFNFVVDSFTPVRMQIWMCIASPIMRIHYYLFRENAQLGSLDGSDALLSLCNMARSLPMSILRRFTASFDPSSPEHGQVWGLLISRLGDMINWASSVRNLAFSGLWLVMGNLWRRFIRPFLVWPFRLARVVDENIDIDDRMLAGDEFLRTSLCCMDLPLSQKLRKFITKVEQLFEPWMQRFLLSIFRRGLVSTSHLENSFAHMRHFLLKCIRAPTIASLSAHHVATELRRIHRKLMTWRRAKQGLKPAKPVARNRRPIWTHSKRRRLGFAYRHNSWSLFLQQYCLEHGISLKMVNIYEARDEYKRMSQDCPDQ